MSVLLEPANSLIRVGGLTVTGRACGPGGWLRRKLSISCQICEKDNKKKKTYIDEYRWKVVLGFWCSSAVLCLGTVQLKLVAQTILAQHCTFLSTLPKKVGEFHIKQDGHLKIHYHCFQSWVLLNISLFENFLLFHIALSPNRIEEWKWQRIILDIHPFYNLFFNSYINIC